MMKQVDILDVNAMRRITMKARELSSIEQINRTIKEEADEGNFCASIYVHTWDGNSLEYKNADFDEESPEVIMLRDAGYQVKAIHDDQFSKLYVCWAENAHWDDKEGWTY